MITIMDTIAYFQSNKYNHIIKEFKLCDTILIVETISDSIILIDNWFFDYSGYQKTDQMKNILDIIGLDTLRINLIKEYLRSINCFGIEKTIDENLILNYRSNPKIMIDVFSYIILIDSQEALNNFMKMDYYYGKLDEYIFWIHSERLLVSYTPFLKLRNRDI